MQEDLLIISKKWSTGRGKYTSVERFCYLLDPTFGDKQGQRIRVPPRISLFFKHLTNSCPNPPYSAPYNSFSFELELWGLKSALINRPRYVFFPYADYDYYYFQYLKKMMGVKVILWTYFSRKELQHRFENLNHFAKADLVLAAGRDQIDYITSQIPHTKVEFFPIGVDTDFFYPSRSFDSYRIVHVGNNRRDFGTLIRGLDRVYDTHPHLKVELIGTYESRKKIPSRPYLNIHNYLSDHRFLSVLQNCNFAVLSLEDGGSSNSLLEAIACGLPVVATDLPNVRDYLDDSFTIRFEQGDDIGLANGCLKLLSNFTLRNQMSIAARYHALLYSWDSLKEQFEHKLAALTYNGKL